MHIEVKGKTIAIDAEGFLVNPADWSEDVAEALAQQHVGGDAIELTETHWGLMEYFREYYQENQVHPTMRHLVLTLGKHHGEHFHEEKAYEKFLYRLFPRGPIQELCKIAGLPKPVDEVQ